MRTILTAALVVLAGQANALSCMPPDIARAFNWAAAADERYIVLNGVFTFNAPDQAQKNRFEQESASYLATFEGSYLGAEGFVTAPRLDVTLNFNCLGPWCGSIAPDGEAIVVFAEQTAQGYTLDIDPCFSGLFPSTDENIARVEACMRGERCVEETF